MSNANDRRIARNSAFLYGRMLITVAISLYTSRVVLDMLGVGDYGIYNVVGSIVTIFTFINGSMAGATQRFLNFAMGQGDSAKLRHTFSASLLIHTCIALIILAAGETIGLWWVNSKLVLEPGRMYAANWAYQLSLVGCLFTVMQVPFVASVIAHERMDVFAYITLLSTFLKLGIALMLIFACDTDTLIFYAWLMLAVIVVTFVCYVVFACRRFEECRITLHSPRTMIRALIGFSLSDIFGNLCYMLRLQSVAIILNRFGGTVLNAAAGLNLTVSGTITQFGSTIISAFRPQIVQQYAAGDYRYMQRLMVNCAKYSLLMIGLMAIPAILCMDTLLSLWLKEVPAYTADFCRLTLIAGAAELIVFTLNCGVHATGRILRMSVTTGVIYLLEIPLMYFLLQLTRTPWIVYAIHIAVIAIIITAVGLILRGLMPEFRFAAFLHRGVAAACLILVAAALPAWGVNYIVTGTWASLCATTATSTVVLGVASWFLAIDDEMRTLIKKKLLHR